jgi:chromosome segregation ATPase
MNTKNKNTSRNIAASLEEYSNLSVDIINLDNQLTKLNNQCTDLTHELNKNNILINNMRNEISNKDIQLSNLKKKIDIITYSQKEYNCNPQLYKNKFSVGDNWCSFIFIIVLLYSLFIIFI